MTRRRRWPAEQGATESWSPLADIGGQPLSPELRSDEDVAAELHADLDAVVAGFRRDLDRIVAAAAVRLYGGGPG